MEEETTRAAPQAVPTIFQRRKRARPISLGRRPSLLALVQGTIPFAVASGAVYLVGFVYHTTRLHTVGINPELYPKETADLFVLAYYAWLTLVAAALPFLSQEFVGIAAIAVFWIGITTLAVVWNYVERFGWAMHLRNLILPTDRWRRAAKVAAIPVMGALLTFYIPVFALVIYAIPVFIGEAAGRRDGQAYLKSAASRCQAPRTVTPSCTEISEGGKVVGYGFVIDASDSYIALVESGRGRSIKREGKEFSTRVTN